MKARPAEHTLNQHLHTVSAHTDAGASHTPLKEARTTVLGLAFGLGFHQREGNDDGEHEGRAGVGITGWS